MSFNYADIRNLLLPVVVALTLSAGGGALIWFTNQQVVEAASKLTVAKGARVQAKERLARISEEEREVKERIEIYRSLINFRIIGKERRLEWVDAIQRIRISRELLDVRYRIEPQKTLSSTPGKPGIVAIHSSTLRLELALLHEGDLLAFLTDLRDAGNAYVSVRECVVTRSGLVVPPPGALTLTPRLRAECQIDLITILDGGSKV